MQLAFRKARKGKSKKIYVHEFEKDIGNKLTLLKEALVSQVYKPLPLKRFVVRDPKTRVVHASAFRDRIVHHAICNILEPIFDKIFIHDSYANRKNKGTLAAIQRFDEFQRKVSQNGKCVKNAKDNNQVVGYVLKADIKKYFENVDHSILLNLLSKKITDSKIIHLIATILRVNSVSLSL